MRGYVGEVVDEAGDDDAELAAGLEEAQEVLEVEVVGPEIVVGIEADDGVEGVRREREVVRLGADWRHAVSDALA